MKIKIPTKGYHYFYYGEICFDVKNRLEAEFDKIYTFNDNFLELEI